MIAIVDYKAGNLTSVHLALAHLGVPAKIAQTSDEILAANRVIFPGVGAARSAMEHVDDMRLADTLKTVLSRGTPFLGICLGTQIIFDHSEEDGGTKCIGLMPGNVVRFTPSGPLCKIPQIGWNVAKFKRQHPLLKGIEDESEFYFVHSYYCAPSSPELTVGSTEYADVEFASMVGRDNLFATQFHPERSGRIGLQLLKNFSEWDGTC